MIDIKFLKTLTTGIALAMMSCPQAWAEIKTMSDCGGDCTWYYDTVSGDIEIKGTGTITQNVRQSITAGGNIRNVTIGEGITNCGAYTWNGVSATGILKFPSTFIGDDGTASQFGTYGTRFRAIDVSAINYNGTMRIAGDGDITLIISDKQGANFRISGGYSNPNSINIQCKGNVEVCQNRTIINWQIPNTVPRNYTSYVGPDDNGNWEVWSDEGLAIYADSTLQKPLGKYDFEGNQTGVYKYDGAGNLTAAYENGISTYKRTSYTPAEAAAAIKKGNNNKITFTFK